MIPWMENIIFMILSENRKDGYYGKQEGVYFMG